MAKFSVLITPLYVFQYVYINLLYCIIIKYIKVRKFNEIRTIRVTNIDIFQILTNNINVLTLTFEFEIKLCTF